VASVGLLVASAAAWAVIVPVVLLVLLATAASIWIPVAQARKRRRGQQLIHEDAERGNLADEVEQMRRGSAGESGDQGNG
jgi:hypothetical protein